ncbi:hypothetical protein [Blastococcus sp. SYSU DS0617]
MTSPSDPRPTEPSGQSAPGTQEIPVAPPAAPAPQLPPHPGATTPAPVQATGQATGPVAFVPGRPGPHPPAPTAERSGASAAEPTSSAPGAPAAWPDSLATGPVPMPGNADEAPSERVPADRSSLLALGLVVAALALLELGLSLRFGGESFWSDIPLWSAFATACTALGLAGSASLLPAGRRPGAGTAWRIAAGGLVGLAAFWVLVVLPVVASDRGFLLTAALACLGAALWTGPARKG